MRRAGLTVLVLLLVGCGGAAAPTATPLATVTVTPVATTTPVVNLAATATRGAELAQVATLTAPTATMVGTPTPLSQSPTAVPPALPSATSLPAPTTAMGISPTRTPTTQSSGGPILTVVTVQGGDPVNIRVAPDSGSPVIALIGAGSDVMVMTSPDVSDSNGQSWVPVNVGTRSGYVRSDLVGPRHVSSLPFPGVFPTPIFLATRVPPVLEASPTTVTVPRPTVAPATRTAPRRVALSHVTITLPGTVDPTDVGNGSSASFFCRNGGSATCRIDIDFALRTVRANDSAQAEANTRIVIEANLEANQILWSEFSSFAHTTRTGLSGTTTTYQLRDRYGTGYVYDIFTMADGAGNVRTIGFQYQGGTDRPVFNTGQIDWYAMLDSITIN